MEANLLYPRNLLLNSTNGTRLTIHMLDRIACLFEAVETPDNIRAFELGFVIIRRSDSLMTAKL